MNSTLARTVILRKNYMAFRTLAIKIQVTLRCDYVSTRKIGSNWIYRPLFTDVSHLKSLLYHLNALKSVIIKDTNEIITKDWVLNAVNKFNPIINKEWVTFVESSDILSQLSIEDILWGLSRL